MIDFGKLTMLIGPRFRRLMGERNDRERLADIKHAKTRRNHPKRHATNQERSHADRLKAAKRAQDDKARSDELAAFKKAVAEYWRGERDEYPKRDIRRTT